MYHPGFCLEGWIESPYHGAGNWTCCDQSVLSNATKGCYATTDIPIGATALTTNSDGSARSFTLAQWHEVMPRIYPAKWYDHILKCRLCMQLTLKFAPITSVYSFDEHLLFLQNTFNSKYHVQLIRIDEMMFTFAFQSQLHQLTKTTPSSLTTKSTSQITTDWTSNQSTDEKSLLPISVCPSLSDSVVVIPISRSHWGQPRCVTCGRLQQYNSTKATKSTIHHEHTSVELKGDESIMLDTIYYYSSSKRNRRLVHALASLYGLYAYTDPVAVYSNPHSCYSGPRSVELFKQITISAKPIPIHLSSHPSISSSTTFSSLSASASSGVSHNHSEKSDDVKHSLLSSYYFTQGILRDFSSCSIDKRLLWLKFQQVSSKMRSLIESNLYESVHVQELIDLIIEYMPEPVNNYWKYQSIVGACIKIRRKFHAEYQTYKADHKYTHQY